ncbi:MAG: glycosyltransferase family A protein, partial [Thermoplasmata archaeon]
MGLTNRNADRLGEVSVGFIPEDSWKGATAPEHPIPLNPPIEDSVPGAKPSVAAGDGPAVSIVVAAHLRPDYIVGAVQSVLRSGLPANQLDIVVTKGYRSDDQDKVLAGLGARVFLDFDVGVGLQLWRAIPLARAPLVAFLDDDDQFETTRLDHVRQIFLERPEIGFYRNRVKLIDLDGEAVPLDLYDAEELDTLLDHTGPLDRLSIRDPNSFHTLRRCHPWFNTSSMVVRRELL